MEEDIDPGLLSRGVNNETIEPEPEPPSQATSAPKKPYHPHIIDLESELDDESDDSKANAAESSESGSDDEAEGEEGEKSGSESESEPESDSEPDSDDDDYTNETLSSTIIREIQQGVYTCLVCTSEIDQYSKVWSCRSCFRVYDLDCIKDWATRGSSTDKASKNWRCPSCNIATNKIPSRFTCWCGRTTNPASNALVPFSCGNPCTYKYESCIHNCSSMCHPGSHPICGAMGPQMKCHCGKSQNQLPCLITPYETGWQCSDPCEVTLCDLGHTCKKGCHSGFCGVCEEDIAVKCYCGKEDLHIKCNEKELIACQDIGNSQDDSEKSSWIGGGACTNKTTVYYDCGVHFEELSCQPLPDTTPVCKLSPSQINTCYCGNTVVQSSDRTKCTDPVPECGSVCNKELPCGCLCLLQCHPGECECHNYFDVKCSCGHETFQVPCKFVTQGYKPKCTHKCQALLSCRKHYHRGVCCEFEPVAMDRERTKKKAIRNNTRSNFEDEIMSIEPVHICTQSCNRLKSCGVHYCEGLCHSGPCGVCLESTNEDLVCHCGKTRIEAPVRCGTKLVCHEQCARGKTCGHRLEIHECHEDSVQCPKCTVMVKKECNCGRRSDVPGVMCSQENVSCGHICTVAKSCGHPCLRACNAKCTKENIHDSSTICRAQCNKIRSTCPHICKLKCHANKPGMSKECDSTRCTESITVSCECGRIESKIACGSTKEEPTKIGTILECDEACAQAKRDKELREAFSFSSLKDTGKLSGESFIYSDLVFQTYEKQTTWCSRIENLMRSFVEDYQIQIENGIKSPRRTYHFPAMSQPQRAFIHSLAEAMNLYTESQDVEPKRSVFIVITRLTKAPIYSISEALRLKKEALFEASRAALETQGEINEASFNALVIQDVFFGISKEELEKALESVVQEFGISDPVFQWIKDSTFAFYSESIFKEGSEEYLATLTRLSKVFRSVLRDKSLAFDCKLCYIDNEATFILKIESKAEKSPSEEVQAKPSQNSFELLAEEEFA